MGSVLAGLRFEAEQVPLDEATKRNVLRSRLDDLDRQARQGGFDFYGCFPREVGARAGTISTGPGSRLPAPVEVTCGTAIEASAAGLWRITLETTWPAGPGYPAGGRIDELFVTGDGRAAGSFEWTLDGSPPPLEGEQAMLPMAPRVLPPLLTGPLNLPVGSIVEMLYPGMYPSVVVDPSSEDLSPYVVGWHFHVVSGPRMAGGDEWYEVQSPDHGLTETTWARGTFQGRPMLALVQPACPSEPIDLDQLAGLLAYEQFACLRGREVTLETVIATDAPPKEPVICLSQESLPTSCPETVASPAWLVGDAQMLVFGPAGPNGVAPAFQVWLDPSVDSLPAGVWLRVHGHVDDAAAADCTSTTSDPMMVTLPRPEMQVLVCRERFVITGFERVSAP